MQTRKILRWYSKRQLADRYSVSTRSIERWTEAGKFPAGTRMPSGHWYWSDLDIEEHERKLTGARHPKSTDPELVAPAG